MQSATFIYRYAECRYAECLYAKCCFAECECRGATQYTSVCFCKFFSLVQCLGGKARSLPFSGSSEKCSLCNRLVCWPGSDTYANTLLGGLANFT
jgi:hypothetical protein